MPGLLESGLFKCPKQKKDEDDDYENFTEYNNG